MFEAAARLNIRKGELDGFKKQVAEIIRLTEQNDTRPLRYDWFISEDGTECEVREAYADADGLLAQQRFLGPAKARLFDFVDEHEMAFYGEPTRELAGAMEAMKVDFSQFSFFQGLEAEAAALESYA